ncbi:MAG TPA: KTSC domain-containing protein [Lysobacter sp.]|nr:KTSC domain-containing protein [Lysobacter sp.]
MSDNTSIRLTRVESSQIAAIGHNPDNSTLAVLFKNRDGSPASLYQYDSVSVEDYAALRDSESVGAHFAKTIKRNAEQHPFRKLDAELGVVFESAGGAS